MAALALALCVPLAATAAHYPTADSAPAARFAYAYLARVPPQTPNAMGWKIASTLHTLLRRNNAHFDILHTIAARAPEDVINSRVQHAAAILTPCSNRDAMAAPLHTPRATPRPRGQLCLLPLCILFLCACFPIWFCPIWLCLMMMAAIYRTLAKRCPVVVPPRAGAATAIGTPSITRRPTD